jgi:hypothetical protein
MKIKRKGPSQQASDGWHTAVTYGVEDLGNQPTPFGPKPKLKVKFLTDERDQEGRLIGIDAKYTATAHESGNLWRDYVRLTGTQPKLNANGEFDTDSLIGINCRIRTERRTTTKGVFANIKDMTPLPPGAARVAIPLEFSRANQPSTSHQPSGGITPPGADRVVEFPGN